DGAADAAVGQLDHVVLGAALDAAAFDDGPVDAQVAELVDDQRQLAAVGRLQQMADESGLAGAEEAGDDGRGNLHCRVPFTATGIRAPPSPTRSAAAATAWLRRPAASAKARESALSGTMPPPTSLETKTTGALNPLRPSTNRAVSAGTSRPAPIRLLSQS